MMPDKCDAHGSFWRDPAAIMGLKPGAADIGHT